MISERKSVVGLYINKKIIFFFSDRMDTICHVGLYCKIKAQLREQALRCVLAACDQLKWP